MRRRCTIAALVSIVLAGVSAPPAAAIEHAWTTSVPIHVGDAAIDDEGNTYVVGDTGREATLTKLGPDGEVIWERSWGVDPDTWAWSSGVALGRGGAVYWAGGASLPCLFGADIGGWFLRKLTSDGRLQWKLAEPKWRRPCGAIGVTVTDVAVARDVVVVSANAERAADRSVNGLLMGFGTGGDARWKAPFEPPGPAPELDDQATGVAADADGLLYAVGWATPDERPDRDARLVVEKVNERGGVVWSRRLPVAVERNWTFAEAHVAAGRAVTVASTERSGDITFGSPPPSAWLGRLGAGGDLRWSDRWGIDTSVGASPGGVAVDPDEGAWVVGTQRDPSDENGFDMFVRSYSPGGTLVWDRVLDGPVNVLLGRGVAATAGGAVVTGCVDCWEATKGRITRYAT